PSREEAGQVLIGPLPHVVKVRGAREQNLAPLRDRPDEDDLPLRPLRGQGAEDPEVHALVDHAEEAETGAWDFLLLASLRNPVGAREVRHVDAARKTMDRGVQPALLPVEAGTAREDHVAAAEKLVLALAQTWRSEPEHRELLHAIVHDRPGTERPRHGNGLGGVEPCDEFAPPLRMEQLAKRGLEHVLFLGAEAILAVRHARLDDAQARSHADDVERYLAMRHGLLDEEDVPARGEAAHDVVRSLEHRVPAEV